MRNVFPPTRRGGKALAAAGLLALALLLGYLGGRALSAGPPHAAPLLDARLPLSSAGAVFAFTISAPTVVGLRVRLEGCTSSGQASLGPLLPAMRPHLVFEPDSEQDHVFEIQGGQTASGEAFLEHPGVYAVRIPGIPRAMGGGSQPVLHVVVTARASTGANRAAP